MKPVLKKISFIFFIYLLFVHFCIAQSPGSISSPTVWFEANNGLNGTVVGANTQVSSWNNLGSFSFGTPNVLVPGAWNSGSVTANAQYMLVNNTAGTGFNYNPVIKWGTNTANVSLVTATATTYLYNALPVSTTAGSVFAVGTNSDVLAVIATNNTLSPCNAGRCGVGTRSGLMEWNLGGPAFPSTVYNTDNSGLPNIYSMQAAISATTYMSVNRSQGTVASGLLSALPQKNGSTNFPYIFALGSFPGYTYGVGNKMAEVIMYNSQLTQAQAQKIESYLAIKYGITLDPAGLSSSTVGYVNSAGNNIYSQGADGTTYWHQVIGIMRDSASGGSALNQKQSHQADDSTRIYLGTLQAINSANSSAFSNNISSIVIGNNTGHLCASGPNVTQHPSTATVRLDREWKIQVTGATPATNVPEDFNMDVTLSSCAAGSSTGGGLGNMSTIGLLVNNTGNLTTGSYFPNFSSYGGKTLTLILNRTTGVITIQNLNAALMAYLNSTSLNASATPLYFTIAALDASVLPVNLQLFEANAINNNHVALNWDIAQASRIQSFTIQRSADAIDWDDVTSIEAINSETSMQHYSAADASPIAGISYYRIKMTDASNAAGYSINRKVFISNAGFSMDKISPNPFYSAFTVNILLPQNSSAEIAVTDMYGRVIKNILINGNAGRNTITVDKLGNLVPGIYIVRASYNGKSLIKKLLKTD